MSLNFQEAKRNATQRSFTYKLTRYHQKRNRCCIRFAPKKLSENETNGQIIATFHTKPFQVP